MDKSQAWRVTRRYAKTAAEWTASEADRRKALRAQRKPLVADARKALAVARTADPDRTRGITHRAERELRAAQRRVPDTLFTFASKAALAAGITAYIGLPLVPARVWWWTAAVVAAVATGTVAVVAARMARRPAGLQPTAEEAALLARLQPEHWTGHCEGRGLAGTLTGRPQLTPSGIVVDVRLDGTWTVKKLRDASESVRALLGCRTDLAVSIGKGSRGGWATMTLRTRMASDGINMTGWKPGDAWAVSTEDGTAIPVPLGKRTLVAGTSGSGKSWSARPLLAEASERPDHRLVIFDRKYIEAHNWQHRARTASELDELREVVAELVAEGEERLRSLPRGEDVISISSERPRITVFVDEGAELLADCKGAYDDVVEGLRTIARKYRAAEIILVWATQKPALSGASPGLDSQIAGQLTVRLSLAVATQTEATVVFGPDAIEKGWKGHELPMPGYALLRDQDKGPKQSTAVMRMRAMSPKDVIALPARPIWQRAAAPALSGPRLVLVKNDQESVYLPEQTNRDRVLAAVVAGARTAKAVTEATGINKGTVSRELRALVKDGAVRKDQDGTLTAMATEATA